MSPRRLAVLGVAGLAAGLTACAELSDVTGWNHEETTPLRTPGLWAVAMTLDGGAYPAPVTQMCIDGASETRMTIVGAQMLRGACSRYEVARSGHEAWTLHSVCALGSASTVTDAQIMGEMNRSYWIRARSMTTGAADPRQNGAHTVLVQATRTGACLAGQRGGDVINGGRARNVFTPEG